MSVETALRGGADADIVEALDCFFLECSFGDREQAPHFH